MTNSTFNHSQIKRLPDSQLIDKTDSLVKEERELLTDILHHLAEIERRRLYSEYGYKSLIDMAIQRFGYSSDQAWRRVQAMRLMTALPEIEEKINSGALNLTHLGLAQTLFKQEAKTVALSNERKAAIIEEIENTTTREAERIVLKHSSSPKAFAPDRERVLNDDLVEYKFSGSNAIAEKAKILKGLLAHSDPNANMAELVEKAFDTLIDRLENQKKTAAPRKIRKENETNSAVKTPDECDHCGSRYALEVDHIVPKAVGGSDHPENLRLLCRSCNQRAAVRFFGLEKMETHLRS